MCRRDVAAFAIDQDVAVVDHLTCLADGVCKTDTVYQVIQTAFQQFQHVLASNAFHLLGFIIITDKLTFEQIVVCAKFLFFQ